MRIPDVPPPIKAAGEGIAFLGSALIGKLSSSAAKTAYKVQQFALNIPSRVGKAVEPLSAFTFQKSFQVGAALGSLFDQIFADKSAEKEAPSSNLMLLKNWTREVKEGKHDNRLQQFADQLKGKQKSFSEGEQVAFTNLMQAIGDRMAQQRHSSS